MQTAMQENALNLTAAEDQGSGFDQLVTEYPGLAYPIAFRILGDLEAAADASQEGFLRACRAIGQFRGGSFRSWLMRIVTDACYDQMRRSWRRPTECLDDVLTDPEHMEESIDGCANPADGALDSELRRVIQAHMEALPVEQRTVLILFDLQGLSCREIATAMGVSVGTVKARLSRGRAMLREAMLENEGL
jgi:RNA polymerase sigma-70 factor, ECF subfamily